MEMHINDLDRKMLARMKEDPHVTLIDMEVDFGVSYVNIRKHTVKLRKYGLLRRVGAKRNGCWEVLDDD